MVVHGIPGPYELKRGDIISLDVGVPRTAGSPTRRSPSRSGRSTRRARKLLDATREALIAGAREAAPGNHLGDISAAIQRHVESQGFSIIRSLVGHGIGRDMHEDPQIPNYGEPGKGPELEPGMVLAIEPMVNAGGPTSASGTTTGPSTRRMARWPPTSSSPSP